MYYSCLLDDSKSFDKVHYGKLSEILLCNKVPFGLSNYYLIAILNNKQGYFGTHVIHGILTRAMA